MTAKSFFVAERVWAAFQLPWPEAESDDAQPAAKPARSVAVHRPHGDRLPPLDRRPARQAGRVMLGQTGHSRLLRAYSCGCCIISGRLAMLAAGEDEA